MISASSPLRFGSFELDLQSGELRKDGLKIRLADQPLQVLTLLLEHPGEVVTREELQRRLWSSDTFVEFEHSLNAAVKRLRDALGDSAENPRYVETLPRHGYRFIAPLGSIAGAPGEQASRSHKDATPRHTRRHWAVAVVVLVVATASYPAGRWIWQRWHRPDVSIHCIAVLPLVNLSNDPSQEYFSDGMTEALITELGQTRTLRVISRQSSMHFKGTPKTIPQIAEELTADALVEGSTLRDGDKVRITIQLVRAKPEEHIWAKSYERDLKDVIALQREVSQAIVSEIQGTLLTAKQRTRLTQTQPVNPEAYQAYLKGRFFWNKRNVEGIRRALDYFQQAIDADPHYAPAYAGLADTLFLASDPSYGLIPPGEGLRRRFLAAQTAVGLDESLAEAHASLAHTYWTSHRPSQADPEFRRALDLNPNYASTHQWYANFLFCQGHSEEALAHVLQAKQLDPLSLIISAAVAAHLFELGRLDEAESQIRSVLEMDPNFAQAVALQASILEERGQFPAAIDKAERAQVLFGDNPERARQNAAAMRRAYVRGGARAYWLENATILKRYYAEGRVTYFDVARPYAQLGDVEQTLAWISKGGCKDICPGALQGRDMAPLRSDPGFRQFLNCAGPPP